MRYAVSGGAPLGERLGHFFRGIGVTVLEGYGLTETTAAVTVNLPGRPADRHRRPAAARHDGPGRGRRRAARARAARSWGATGNNEAGTAEARRDGWFRTGDLGELDDEGFPSITGRKKEILVTAGGKNVAPAVLEDRVRAHRWSASAWWSATAGRSSPPRTLVSQAEAIRRFAVLPDDWTEEEGHLTPSLKLKRAVVLAERATWTT